MPFKADKVSLRTRPSLSNTKTVVAPPDRTPIEWLQFGLESSRHTKIGWLQDWQMIKKLSGNAFSQTTPASYCI
jgi:hypothetical protein